MAVKGLLVMDVDSTLIEEEVIDLLGEKADVGDKISEITAAAMSGEIDFKESLRERVALLSGLPTTIFDDVYKEIHLTKGATGLIETLHAKGWKVGLVSGGFHEIVDKIARDLKIDYVFANRLSVENGHLTGKTHGTVVDKDFKVDRLKQWANENKLNLSEVIAVGDGANDIPMLNTAGIGIAFCAKTAVKAAVCYHIDKRNLLTVLEFVDKLADKE
ncbi:Phosphoserine phosphatase [Lactococcus lactis subsp. lactis]|uniref:phosphoserine phosphatase n=2 Tax=Lactococcus lactis TaxID=1358 RepID=A0A2A5SI04_LACLH|nr:phosphoserine phosphatase SerB [Lactococcus lactis]KAA8703374.1 phosphoserine phosphatase SerB [Lactococcus lactis subsp. hordniae]KSU11492.1 Phosphoserine phosphatase [Lactococcus lactis subsp. lactis]MCT3135662.1 phosphoserine phosphatase SerB [Lactococcus lactis]PCS13070.1 phosphoserine phosphatase [Lactococcus lactis subsp. hordniae]